jgi:hypothetical protein
MAETPRASHTRGNMPRKQTAAPPSSEEPTSVWRPPRWVERFRKADSMETLEVLLDLVNRFEADATIPTSQEASQMRQMVSCMSAHHCVILAAAMASFPDDAAGKAAFLALVRTIACSAEESAPSAPLLSTLRMAPPATADTVTLTSPLGGGFFA